MTTATAQNQSIERAAFWCIAASLGIVQIKIMPAQVLFGVAAILWLVLAIREGWRQPVPAFTWPLACYAALTLASSAFSIDPVTSVIDSKQLILFLIVPIVARMARGDRALQALDVILAVGAAGAIFGIIQFAIFGRVTLGNRPTGTLSHVMTFSGVLMLATCAAVARLLFYPKQIIWPAIAVPALLVALAGTFTRSAWIGTLAGLTTLLGLRRPRLLIAIPILVGIFFVAAPASLKERALSTFDVNDPSNRDRLQMLEMGREMVRDHPLFGVGPMMVEREYAKYLQKDPVHQSNLHLHDVPVQIAAERGLPALAAWIWFVVVAARDLLKQVKRGPAHALAAAGLAAIVTMIVAGFFEYNFGDSEFLMLFLGLTTLPFAARQQTPPSPA